MTLFAVDPATDEAALLADLAPAECASYCADAEFDAVGGLLYMVAGEEDDGDDAVLVVLNVSAAPVALAAAVPLSHHFAFPQWDAKTRSIFGLELSTGPYARNMTLLADPARTRAFSPTSHGALGDGLYVILSEGPKAFDPATRRAFYMLANGPFAEFDVATVDIDADPVQLLETPGLCGFIGYCPQAFAFAPGS